MNLLVILLIVLVVVAVLGLPHWGYAQQWNYGYYPTGIITVVVVILLVLLLLGRV